MKRGQGSLEYLLILAAILAIAVVAVLVANSVLGTPADATIAQQDKYGLALAGFEVNGYDKPFDPANKNTLPQSIVKGDNIYFYNDTTPPDDADVIGELTDSSGNKHTIWAWGGGGGGSYGVGGGGGGPTPPPEPGCGDSTIDAEEECDPPGEPCVPVYGEADCIYCNASCMEETVFMEFCGDLEINGPEECDDGNTINNDYCSNTCIEANCTDGIRNQDERDVDCGGVTCGFCPRGEWMKGYGTSGLQTFYQGNELMTVVDDGFIALGNDGSNTKKAFVMKINETGNLTWKKVYDPGIYSLIMGYGTAETPANYAVVGTYRASGTAPPDTWVSILNKDGSLNWTKHYNLDYGGVPGPGYSVATTIDATSDGGYIVGGYGMAIGSSSASGRQWDPTLIKLTSTGAISWVKVYPIIGDDRAWSVKQTTDGGYVLVGGTQGYGGSDWDVLILKTTSTGIPSWTRWVGGSSTDMARSVIEDGTDLVVAGFTGSYGGTAYDALLMKLDKDGNKKWIKAYGGTANDQMYSVAAASDGGYFLTGQTKNFGASSNDYFAVKTDSGGTLDWAFTYGTTGEDYGRAGAPSDTGYAVYGRSDTLGNGGGDVLLVQAANNGSIAGCTYDVNVTTQVTETTVTATPTSVTPSNLNGNGPTILAYNYWHTPKAITLSESTVC
ncbi:class III signal peptide-containing protein [archaeon]